MNKYLEIRNKIAQTLWEYSEITAHHGMIGWVRTEDGLPEYVYGEITGYFLSFCSYIGRRFPETQTKLTAVMQEHVLWLHELATKGFVTRLMLNNDHDWRNSALFFFDISMIIRGLQDASTYVETSETLHLYKLISDKFVDREQGMLSPCIGNAEDTLPNKWSTRFDAHLMKAVANTILEYTETTDDDIFVKDILCKTKDSLLAFDEKKLLMIDSHPLLYYIEGLGLLSCMNFCDNSKENVYIKKIMDIYKNLMRISQKSILLNNPTQGTFYRSDVLSQFVRIGSVLKRKNMINSKDFDHVRFVLDYTLDHFLVDGKVCFFDKTQKGNYYNTWCAMFLYQALDFFIIASSENKPGTDIGCDWNWIF